jgi:hypothetical protein
MNNHQHKLRTTWTKKNHDLFSSSSSIIMWGSRLLLTVSTADISVLQSAEVVQLYPQAVYPLYSFTLFKFKNQNEHFRGEWLGIHYEVFTEYT